MRSPFSLAKTMNTNELPPFYGELKQKVESLDEFVIKSTMNLTVYDKNHPEGFPSFDLDKLAHMRGLMMLLKLVVSDFEDELKYGLSEIRESLHPFERFA